MPIQEFKAGVPANDGTLALPNWLTIKSTSANRTAQTSAATIKTGFAANAARAQSRDGTTWGLMVENDRINYCKQDSNLAGGWGTTNMVTLSGSHTIMGPDGSATSADEITWTNAPTPPVDSGFFPPPPAAPAGNQTWTSSHWEKWAAGAGDVKFGNASSTVVSATRTPTTNWGRLDWTETTAAAMRSWTRKQANSPNVIDHFGCQMELGAYPTSLVPVGAAATAQRTRDTLAVGNPSTAIPNGYFDVTLIYTPAYAQNEVAGDHMLFYVDANNNVRFRSMDQKVVLKLAGSDTMAASDKLTFARGKVLTVRAKHSATEARVEVAGADAGNSTHTDTAKAAIASLPTTVYLFGDDKGATEAVDVRQVGFF